MVTGPPTAGVGRRDRCTAPASTTGGRSPLRHLPRSRPRRLDARRAPPFGGGTPPSRDEERGR
ncbi:MAG: hypothetical protein AVDCRST_MAG54-4242 [uncultured Actinomycetospora sp.]|uniref:Uncharacterized protein n=1 Tax=uncultured Actinomycetospora sp. TaxID=1135996 RepID=A0A6J4JVP1_9PSEU|nr:MAG: hypothetical protein AVDCRST_MAG54-4242 [uncultured Actinomycetospora sp.]